jgi:pimeloyl-ACP methyl ester carboxylesterase
VNIESSVQMARYRSPSGISLSADVGGPEGGALVVLMHGGGQTRHSWSGTMRKLVGEGFRVINLDARGHGESDWANDGDYTPAAQASDLASVLCNETGPVTLVGASMGGMTALFAAGNGQRADALVLVDIVPRPARKGIEKITTFMTSHGQGFAALEEAVEAVAAYNPHRARPRDPSGLRRNLRLRDDGRLYWHWDPRLLEMRGEDNLRQREEDMLDACSRIRNPVLLVRGGQSDVVDENGIAQLKMHLPQLEVVDVSGAGHMVAGDRNDAFGAALLPFLRRNMPSH